MPKHDSGGPQRVLVLHNDNTIEWMLEQPTCNCKSICQFGNGRLCRAAQPDYNSGLVLKPVPILICCFMSNSAQTIRRRP